jgi:hypothetical protein
MINYIQIKKNLLLFTAMILFMTCGAIETFAQDKAAESQLTWKDLGFNGIPEGISTEELSIIKRLNEGRGTWTFEGSVSKENETLPVQGKLEIKGGSKMGMLPMWGLTIYWPPENPQNMINYVIMVAPERNQVGLSLFRIGPITVGADGKPSKDELMKTQRTPFEGTWDPERMTVLWKKKEMPERLGGKKTAQQQEAQTKVLESFEMTLSLNGKVAIQNLMNASAGLAITGKAMDRMGEPVAKETLTYNKDIRYATVSDISEAHIKRYLPPKAVDITLNLQRNGHLARYKVSEKDFLSFLDDLWQGEERDKGVAVNMENRETHFDRLGWKPLENVISYHSPTKPNGAMSTYYFDAKTETVYENTGYW